MDGNIEIIVATLSGVVVGGLTTLMKESFGDKLARNRILWERKVEILEEIEERLGALTSIFEREVFPRGGLIGGPSCEAFRDVAKGLQVQAARLRSNEELHEALMAFCQLAYSILDDVSDRRFESTEKKKKYESEIKTLYRKAQREVEKSKRRPG